MPAPNNNNKSVLVADIGGTHVKLYHSDAGEKGKPEAVKIVSGSTFTPRRMVTAVKRAAAGWKYDVVAIGYPGPVLHGSPLAEPHNLAAGWVGFDFRKAFGKPVKLINDAALQALGSYKGGRMLFLGLGTGLGTALIVDGIVEPMELAHLPYKKGRTYEDYIGLRGLKRLGKKRWREAVNDVVEMLKKAVGADYVVIGGGNVKLLKELPPDSRWGDNSNAYLGGVRLFETERSTPRAKQVLVKRA